MHEGTGNRGRATGVHLGFRVQALGCPVSGSWQRRRDRTRSPNFSVIRTLCAEYSVLSTRYSDASTLRFSILCFLVGILAAPACAAEPVPFADRLASIAAKCDEVGLKEQAAITRDWIIPRHPGRQYLFLPPDVDSTAPKVGSSETIRQWHKKFSELRREQAATLYAEAQAASNQQQPARAYRWLYEVLREDPDHAEARRILGYVKVGTDWRLPDWEKMVARQPPNNHPKLDWRARGYWLLETPHFQIVTNHSKAELLEAGQQLENLHTLWRQIFFRYWSSAEALAARFAGRNEPLARERPKMQVVVFKSRADYAAHVAAAHPKAATTLGLYDDKQRTAYFYGGDTSVYPTWFHEATHQLFQQAIPNTRDEPGQDRNFWALEGAALYMESLANHGEYWTAGGCDANRLQFARYRVLSGDVALPLDRISALSRDAIQKSDDIGRIYTQAAGLTHFLIDGEQSTYRDAFIDLLTAIYHGADLADSLGTATGQPLAKLDEQYRAFLSVTDDDLAGIPDPTRLRNLSLCRTSVTDKGLARFARCKSLQWLDLSFTAATDEGLKCFSANAGLKQLFLEGTKVTSASLPLIAGFKPLEQLDLSGLAIKDDDLASLASLRSLKTLYLTGCPITDAGLTHLRGFKQLERLDHDGTQVTPEGLKRLKTALPKLNLPSPSPQP
jgi:Leucine Rich Repeat (LRR) protein